MPVEYVTWITRDMVRADRSAIFVFGDNTERVGFGGQAAAMRGEPNAIGIATKRNPSMDWSAFFRDDSIEDRKTILADLGEVRWRLEAGQTVYVPIDGLGTGLSQLPTRAPKLYQLIRDFFAVEGGKPCPWSP